ncbi:hypothetical protein RE628_15510 [Paenibacillus sp. D2_2]|uniref:hypothetical protein n=1 Tax=Paenibacillus sp. D2_2 TaxID=3073092 RepID=UPI0028153D1F|nr:hypothetical protein [Paenibacillus sp. D2_2]WMT38937.1 hypothetical protein RE628_15510 [Paenibacillus sp. D2_2]
MEGEFVLVASPNPVGRKFILLLMAMKRNFIVLVNNKKEEEALRKLGVSRMLRIKTDDEESWDLPPVPIGCCYIFELSTTLTCRYLQICRHWTNNSIFIITPNRNPRMIYKGLGASYVIHSVSGEVGFLLAAKSGLEL